MAVAPDGRIFVCEQTGTLRVVKDGTLLPEPFVTLDVDSSWERGLIGVTLDPDFARNGYVYVCYVTPNRPYVHHRVSRFTACGRRAAPGSELVLLEGDDQAKLGGNVPAGHQGGALHFGADGKLYVALGDQTAGKPAQELTTFQGKLLRLNPDGSIPEDNPFAEGRPRQVPRDLGDGPPQPVPLRRPAGHRPDLHQRRGARHNGKRSTKGSPAATTAGPRARARRPTRGSASRSTTTRSPRSPAGPSARPGPRPTSRPAIAAGTSSWTSSRAGSRSSTPIIRNGWRPSPKGLMRPVDMAFGADGKLYALLRDAWVVDSNFRTATGSLLRIGTDRAGGEHVEGPDRPRLRGDGPRRDGLLQGRDARRQPTSTASGAPASRASSTRTGATGSPTGPATRPAASIGACPSAASRPSSSTAATATASTGRRIPSPAASRLASRSHVRIESETRDGKSACRWDFYPDHATLTLLKIDLPTYWFLYEGTPGGALDAEKDFVIRPDGRKTTLDHAWSQVVPWVCFGASETPVGFVLRQPSGAGAGRGRLLRLLALPEGRRRVVPGHDRLRLRQEGVQGAHPAHPRPEATAGAIQHRVHRSGRLQHGQGDVRAAPTGFDGGTNP